MRRGRTAERATDFLRSKIIGASGARSDEAELSAARCLEGEFVFDILLYIGNRDTLLLHAVTLTDSYTAVFNAVKIVCDAERSTYLVLSAVSLADSACVVIVNAEVL